MLVGVTPAELERGAEKDLEWQVRRLALNKYSLNELIDTSQVNCNLRENVFLKHILFQMILTK